MLFVAAARVLRYLGGVALVVVGALGMAGLASAYSIILLSDRVFFPPEVQTAVGVLQGSAVGIVAMVSSSIMMGIPLLVLIIAGASLLAKRNYFTVQKSVTLAVVWIVALVVAGTTAALQVEKVMQRIGPIEAQFTDSHVTVQWEGGHLYGDEHEVRVYTTASKPPERVTVAGTYNCIEASESPEPPQPCMSTITTAASTTYALNFMLMSQTLPPLERGDRIEVSGVHTPVERLSAQQWHELEVAGIISVTTLTTQ